MADDGVPIHVLRTQGVPINPDLPDPQPPFQLLVYNLPPPPPGFLYGFTCSPFSVLLPPVAIAPLPDSSSPRSPDPSTSGDRVGAQRNLLQLDHLVGVSSTEIVPVSSSDVNSLSVARDLPASFQSLLFEETRRSSSLNDWTTADSSSCTKTKESPSDIIQPQSATTSDEMSLALADQEYNRSTSLSSAQADSDEAIQENDRLNKALSLIQTQKTVGMSSPNGCTLATARTVQELYMSAEISSYRSPVFVDKQELRDRIVERWWCVWAKPQK